MRIRITVQPPRPAEARAVLVDAPAGTTAVQLAEALGWPRLEVGGCLVPDHSRVGMPPLLEGAVVGFPAGRALPSASGWELWVLSGPDAGLRFPLPAGSTALGRARHAGVALSDAAVSRRHALLEAAASGVRVRDLGGTNGTRVCDEVLGSSTGSLTDGDDLEVGDSRLELRRTAPRMRDVRSDGVGHLLVVPPPRRAAPAPATVPFPEPPTASTAARFPLATLLVPLVLAAVLALVMRSPAMTLFGLTGPALSLTTWWAERRRSRRGATHPEEHEAALSVALESLAAACARDRADLEREHPPPAAVLATAERRSAGLWSGSADTARLEVRLGVGDRPTRVRVDGGLAPPVPMLCAAPITVDLTRVGMLGICGPRSAALAAARTVLGRLAVSFSPADLEVHVLVNTVRHGDAWDVAGDLPQVCGRHLAAEPASLLARLAAVTDDANPAASGGLAAHGGGGTAAHRKRAPPQRPRLVLFVDGARALRVLSRFDHLLHGRPGRVVAVVVDTDRDQLPASCGALLDVSGSPARLTVRDPLDDQGDDRDIGNRLGYGNPGNRRVDRDPGKRGDYAHPGDHEDRGDRSDPGDGAGPVDSAGPGDVAGSGDNTGPGGSTRPCASGPHLPSRGHHVTVGTCADSPPATVLSPDLPSPDWLPRLARALAPLRDPRDAQGKRGLPESVRLLDLVGPASLDELEHRWAVSARGSTRVVLGATDDGPMEVDLGTDGPHALVGGTTGAGKSELLQTLVCSLALANRPDELSFLLLDYKGGAAFRGCARLPHVVGLVTDLDSHLTARALVSLAAELRRREQLLAEVGAASLDEYQRHRAADPAANADGSRRRRSAPTGVAGPDPEPRSSVEPGDLRPDAVHHSRGARWPPLPRLVIVIDEFRVLAEELPDFVHGLVRLAAVGRSLGVHLVLATQRPGGIVSADIRANVSLRIALRVRDRVDSTDVLEAPDAAQIDATRPGRAYLRGAPTALTQFQTARVTAHTPESAGLTVTDVPPWWRPSDLTAEAAVSPAGESDLDRIVAATRAASARMQIAVPAPPWLPPLPDSVAAQSLSGRRGDVVIGLDDDPDGQRQTPWCWDPFDGGLGIAGGSRSGRTTAALTAALGLAAAYPPSAVHLYVLGPPALSVLSGLPHTATVAPLDDADRVRLVVDRLREVAGSATAARVVVVVDGWEQLAALAHGAPAAELKTLLETGGSAGLRAVLTGGRALLAGQLVALLARRLILPVGDPVELALAGIPAKAVPVHQPPGRGLDPRTRHEVQVATYADPAKTIEQVTSAWAGYTDSQSLPRPVCPLPRHVATTELLPTVPLTIALREGDLEAVGFDPAGGHRRIVVAGPPRTGRTTALVTVVHALAAAGYPIALVGVDLGRAIAQSLSATQRARPAEAVVTLAIDGRDDDDRDALVEVRRRYATLAVLADDAERLAGLPIEPVLLEIARRADEAAGLVAAATTTPGVDGRGGALLTELARAHTGLILCPTAGTALLGSVLPAVTRHPGRGVLVADGTATRVQVAQVRP